MTDPIPYDEMRRILGLPARRGRIGAPWTVRKIREGIHAGRWGVWRLTGGTRELVEAHRAWSDAISDACTRSDGR
ncbi:hypothetical protein ACFTSD_15420 [Nocardiaceae bacterium NPDC056970]|jgi:hypothetical protein